MKVDIYRTEDKSPHLLIVKHGVEIVSVVPALVYENEKKWIFNRSLNLSPSTPLLGISAEVVLESIQKDQYFSTFKPGYSANSTFGVGIGAGILAASLGLTPFATVIASLIAAALVVSSSKEKK